MQVLERTKEQIQTKSERMNDFLRMEYLEACTKQNIDISTMKYCSNELSKLYEKNHMYSEAIKYLNKLKEISPSQKERNQVYKKEVELLIKGGFYEKAEAMYNSLFKSLAEEKYELNREMIETYKNEASNFEKANKNAGLLKVYEKLIHHLNRAEKTEIKKKMFVLYKRLGKVKESIEIERDLETFS